MQAFPRLIDGYRRFREHGWPEERARWSELAAGQSPKVMVIACSDSRVDPAQIFDRALARLVAELERRKLAAVRRPRPGGSEHGRHASGDAPPRETLAAPARSKAQTRHIPAQVRREVWARDAGRCAVVGTAGRCTERGLLEFHHRVPYGDGGETTAANLELRCRLCRYRHNSHYAEWRIMPRSPSATRSAAICSCFYAA